MRFVMYLQTKFLLRITRLQKYLYILNGLLNRASQLIHQYFIRQVSLFANILPLQIFPTYGIHFAYTPRFIV